MCCQCLSVQKPGAREKAREGAIRRRGGSTNLGRRSDAPQNIGQWSILFPSLRRKDLSCINSAADSPSSVFHLLFVDLDQRQHTLELHYFDKIDCFLITCS